MKCPFCAIDDCAGCRNYSAPMIERGCTCKHEHAMPHYCAHDVLDEYDDVASCDLIAGHASDHKATGP